MPSPQSVAAPVDVATTVSTSLGTGQPFESTATALSVVVAQLGGVGTTDVLAWTSIALFVVAVGLGWRGSATLGTQIGALAWVVFGVFWLTMAPYYYYDVQSPLQSILALVALPLCVYTGYVLYRGRESLLLLTKAVAIMGLIYLPAETIPFARQWLIETVAIHTHYGMELLGHSPGINEGVNGYQSRFDFDPDETVTGRTTYIVLACTGLGSMAIFGGLIAAVRAPLKRKLSAFVVVIAVIWLLNLARNVFIGLASPYGWFQQDWLVNFMTTYLGAEADRVSYLVAHNYISQPLSIVVLLVITYGLVKLLPEVLVILEEVLYLITGSEYDLAGVVGEDVDRAQGAASDD